MTKFMQSVLRQHNEYINGQLERIIRIKSIPVIKGEITPGKIKWRGVKLCIRQDGNIIERWVEQRGKQIGWKIYWKIEFNHIEITTDERKN